MRRRQNRRAARLPVACFYCEERFPRTQERATHIRHHHKGMPYRPDRKELQEETGQHALNVTVVPESERPTANVVAGGRLVDVLAPTPDEMTPKQHLVAAISSIKRRQQEIDKQAPELEKQLESLRAEQKKMEAERQALETALGTIDGVTREAPAASASVR